MADADDGVLPELPSERTLELADDGLPVLRSGPGVTNDEVIAAIRAERDDR